MADMRTDFCGLELRNPLIAGSGPITGNAELVRALHDNGIGAVVTKTSLLEAEYGPWIGRRTVFPYRPVYKYMELSQGRLLSLPSLAAVPLREMAREVEKMKRFGATVIGSVGATSRKGYVESARILALSGVDAIELNYCCTIPAPQRLFGVKVNFDPASFAAILRDVKRKVSVPVGFKSTVSLYLYEKVFEGMIRAKLLGAYPDFANLSAQLDANPGVDLETLKPIVPHFPVMGWQGNLSELTYSAVAAFATSFGTSDPKISASGGIVSAKEALNAMALGASSVQVHTAILDKGPGVIGTMLDDMETYLERKGIGSIGKIVGVASSDYIPAIGLGDFMRERGELFGKVSADVDASACSRCGLCARICTEGGITFAEGAPTVDLTACRACNLCVLKCPKRAISLKGAESLEQLISASKASPESADFREFMAKSRIGLSEALSLPRRLRYWHMR